MCNIIAVAKQKEFQINKTYNRAESSKENQKKKDSCRNRKRKKKRL
jgi:hypothetical protein